MSLPRLLVTGASGFVGRHLLEALKQDYLIYGLARRSQAASGAPVHPNISWFQADIADAVELGAVVRAIVERGGADYVVHLAAHYDFTGEEHNEYWRTNVNGLRNVLVECRRLAPRRFVFPSSLAACAFPRPGRALDENSPPSGRHIYARSKAMGEHYLENQFADIPSTTIRFAALYSDYCEYAPLFMFLRVWLSQAWNRRILGGRGLSAIPYLHIRDGVDFIRRLLEREQVQAPQDRLVASPDSPISHRELFEAATLHYHGERGRPLLMPRLLCRPGIWARDWLGRVLGERPFERTWMADYIDQRMSVDGSATRRLLGFEPRARLDLLRRMPFLIHNMKNDPLGWSRRNHAALKEVRLRPHLRVHMLLKRREAEIGERLAAGLLSLGLGRRGGYDDLRACHDDLVLALRHLIGAVASGERDAFGTFCRDLAARRHSAGVRAEDVCARLAKIDEAATATLATEPAAAGLEREIHDHVSMLIRFGCDEVLEVYEQLGPAPNVG